jgi:molecular chaperone DnaK (HSP70)
MVVMVGGSTYVPRVRQALLSLPDRLLVTSVRTVVAIGAAIQADALAGNA